MPHLLVIPLLENQRSINSTERKVVCHNVFGVDVAALAGDVVEWCTLWIDVYEVYVRMEPAFVHHVDCEPAFYTTAGTKNMADVALC